MQSTQIPKPSSQDQSAQQNNKSTPPDQDTPQKQPAVTNRQFRILQKVDPGNLLVDNHQASKKTDSHKRKSVEVWNEYLTCRLIELRNSEFWKRLAAMKKIRQRKQGFG